VRASGERFVDIDIDGRAARVRLDDLATALFDVGHVLQA
jgi:hypothetical protein